MSLSTSFICFVCFSFAWDAGAFFIVLSLDTIHSCGVLSQSQGYHAKKNATIQTHTKATTKLVRQIKPKTATKEPASRRNTHKNGNTEQMNLNKCFGQMRHGRRMEWFLWAYYNRKSSMKSIDSCLFFSNIWESRSSYNSSLITLHYFNWWWQ